MNCTTCVKINPVPDCLGVYSGLSLSGISFPDNTGDELLLKITDTATRQVWYSPFTEGDEPELSAAYPLMQHVYKLEFFHNGIPVNFVITNPDDTVSDGCCIEFLPHEAYEYNLSSWPVTTTQCVVE